MLFQLQEQNIPIDIHIGKLLEWLTSRHIVGKNWHTKITEIRNRIAHAINDMPSHDQLVKLLSGTRTYSKHLMILKCIDETTISFQTFTTSTVYKSLKF